MAAPLAFFLRCRAERKASAGLPPAFLGGALALLLLAFGGLTWAVLASGPIVALDARLTASLAASLMASARSLATRSPRRPTSTPITTILGTTRARRTRCPTRCI